MCPLSLSPSPSLLTCPCGVFSPSTWSAVCGLLTSSGGVSSPSRLPPREHHHAHGNGNASSCGHDWRRNRQRVRVKRYEPWCWRFQAKNLHETHTSVSFSRTWLGTLFLLTSGTSSSSPWAPCLCLCCVSVSCPCLGHAPDDPHGLGRCGRRMAADYWPRWQVGTHEVRHRNYYNTRDVLSVYSLLVF